MVQRLAAEQHGVVARRQLLARGLSSGTIDSYVRSGRLVVLRRGVYAAGHAELRREGWWMAAVLAAGSGTALSHGHAAAHWGLLDEPAGRIHVTRPTREGRRARRGLEIHRPETLEPDELVTHDGIPVTTVARTILDVGAHVPGRRLEQVVRRAARLRRFDLVGQRAMAARHPLHPGARPLLALLDRLHGRGTEDMRSVLEEFFLQLCDDRGFPAPVVNGHVLGERVDFHWRHARLVVETDGFEWHSMPSSFEADRLRDQRLTVAGWRVVRFTYAQVRVRPDHVSEVVAALLRAP